MFRGRGGAASDLADTRGGLVHGESHGKGEERIFEEKRRFANDLKDISYLP